MTFGELVDHARERTYSLLREHLEKREAEGFKTYAEPAMRNDSGEIVCAPDGLKLPLRYDLAFQDTAGKVHTENVDSSTLNFREPVFAQWENRLKIEIHSLSWDYIRFQLKPATGESDWEGLRNWFLRWFDVHDEKVPDANGLSGVVHFIGDPEFSANEAVIFVDFGSASPEALGEFFDELIKLGAKSCIIGKPGDPSQFVVKV